MFSFLPSNAIPNKEMLTIKTPNYSLNDNISLRKIAPKNVAIIGEMASIVSVFLVPIILKAII